MAIPHVTAFDARMAALRKAYELLEQLKQLVARPEYGEGSCPAHALDRLEDVISSLKPTPADPDEEDDPGAPRLRIVRALPAEH